MKKRLNPLDAGRNVDVVIETTKERTAGIPADVQPEVTILALQRAGVVSSDPTAARAKPAGSSPALRIACPVGYCQAPAGSYCKRPNGAQQTIAHKRRRDLELASRPRKETP